MYQHSFNEVIRIAVLALLLSYSLFACHAVTKPNIKVAVSSNARFAVEEIVETYTNLTGHEIELIVSSSGKLTAQILEGAPFDVFLSADLDYPNKLFTQGMTTAKPVTYAYGTLGMWTTNTELDLSIDKLSSAKINHIACPNPKTAPYGKAAIEALNKSGMFAALSSKLIYGESVSQVSQFVYSQAADVGFISSSVINAPHLKGKGRWFSIDQNLYSPIAQGAVVIKQNSSNSNIPSQFLQFLSSKESKAILKKYGYRTN